MNVGMMLTTARPDHWSEAEVFDNAVTFAVEAENVGYQSLWLLEHHFTRYGLCPHTQTMAGFILGRTRRIRVGTAVVVAPLEHPIRLAEQTALLDHLSHGRFTLGLGRGFFPKDFEAFDVDPTRTHESLEQWIDILRQIWTSRTARWDTDLIHIPDVTPFPSPYTAPYPPMYAVGQSPSTIEMAASRAIPLIIPVTSSLETMRADVQLYAEYAEDHGVDPASVRHAVASIAYVADSPTQAYQDIFDNFCWWNKEGADAGFDADALAKLPNYRFQYGELRQAALRGERTVGDTVDNVLKASVIGDPQGCVDRLEQIIEVTGVQDLILGFEGTLDRELILSSMRRFATEVLPRIGWVPSPAQQGGDHAA